MVALAEPSPRPYWTMPEPFLKIMTPVASFGPRRSPPMELGKLPPTMGSRRHPYWSMLMAGVVAAANPRLTTPEAYDHPLVSAPEKLSDGAARVPAPTVTLPRVDVPVTPNVPPTVALPVTAALARVASPEVDRVLREVLPVTPRVPPTVSLPVTALLARVAAEAERPARVVAPVTARVVLTVALARVAARLVDSEVTFVAASVLTPATLTVPVKVALPEPRVATPALPATFSAPTARLP